MLQRNSNFTNIMAQTETIGNNVCHMIARLGADYGVRHIVVSPGTRSAPLVVSLNRSGLFDMHTVIDERCAAFMALGMSLHLDEPVILVCTSGSAIMNYGPAFAEAYYRHVPLIAVTADRPERWIDQLDSQTMRQPGALAAVVRRTVDIPAAACRDRDLFDKANRDVNEAFDTALTAPRGPVHINVHIDLFSGKGRGARNETVCQPEKSFAPRYIPTVHTGATVSDYLEIVKKFQSSRILVVFGDTRKMSLEGPELQIPLLGEAQSKIAGHCLLAGLCDRFLDEAPVPDIVVTMGGSLVSARLKKWLRELENVTHIHVGREDHIPDTFGYIDGVIKCEPAEFLKALYFSHVGDSSFYFKWFDFYNSASTRTYGIAQSHPVTALLDKLFRNFNGKIHVSNGSAIRYAQTAGLHDIFCNRGISGIDGCTSTALGAAIADRSAVMLITGDMSFAYDIGALGAAVAPPGFRIVVLDNNGGDIFRNIATTASLPERDRFFVAPPALPLRQLAQAYGYEYYEYNCDEPDESSLAGFLAGSPTPRILRVIINPEHTKNLL